MTLYRARECEVVAEEVLPPFFKDVFHKIGGDIKYIKFEILQIVSPSEDGNDSLAMTIIWKE